MKKLLPFLFLVSAPAYADMNHSISSSVKFESLSAASTADKIGTSYSISGNNITTVDSTQQLQWVDSVLLQMAYQQSLSLLLRKRLVAKPSVSLQVF